MGQDDLRKVNVILDKANTFSKAPPPQFKNKIKLLKKNIHSIKKKIFVWTPTCFRPLYLLEWCRRPQQLCWCLINRCCTNRAVSALILLVLCLKLDIYRSSCIEMAIDQAQPFRVVNVKGRLYPEQFNSESRVEKHYKTLNLYPANFIAKYKAIEGATLYTFSRPCKFKGCSTN